MVQRTTGFVGQAEAAAGTRNGGVGKNILVICENRSALISQLQLKILCEAFYRTPQGKAELIYLPRILILSRIPLESACSSNLNELSLGKSGD